MQRTGIPAVPPQITANGGLSKSCNGLTRSVPTQSFSAGLLRKVFRKTILPSRTDRRLSERNKQCVLGFIIALKDIY